MTARFAIVLSAAALVGATPALGATDRSPLRFTQAPHRAVQNATVAFEVATRSGTRCSLGVRYRNGTSQPGLGSAVARAGRASWRWTIPFSAQPGAARVTASCAGVGSASRTLVVIGNVMAPRVEVVKRGFSVRVNTYGGSDVSYGLILRNASSTQDARDVNVLVNFVMSDNRLIGSAGTSVPLIAAGGTYALGNSLSFPAFAPVARLEVVVQVGSHGAHSQAEPALANVRVLPDVYDPAWVGSVEGEVVNDQPGLTLQNATLSAVVFDAAGNVIGGGQGWVYSTLPPGSRQFFKLTTGLRAIPAEKAADVEASVLGTWRAAGT